MQYPGLRVAVAILTFVTGLTSAAVIGNVRLMPEVRLNRARCAERVRTHRRRSPPPPATALPAEPPARYAATDPPVLLSPPPPPRSEQPPPAPRARAYPAVPSAPYREK